MIIQRLCDLSGEMAAGVIELLYGAQITGKQSREDIRNFVAGRCFDDGRFMLAAIDNDRVLATGGAVVAEASRGEIFITAMAAAPGAESALNDILKQIIADIALFPDCVVKLGIGGKTKVPADFPGAFGFSPAYSLLQMKFAGTPPAAKSSAHIELTPLSADNIDEYVSTTNAGFAGTPNAATIQADDARQMLDNKALRCGLIRTGNHTIGCYELKLDGSDGWIESVSLLPASRGKGNGGAAVVRLIEMLRQLGSTAVKLSVIDANEKAYVLYQRLGFAVDHVLSRWYVKK